MKKLFIAMMMAVAMMLPMNVDGAPKKAVTIEVDSTKTGGKSVKVAIDERLNDTLFDMTHEVENEDTDEVFDNHVRGEIVRGIQQTSSNWDMTAVLTTGIVFGSTLLVVITALIASYLHRRQKYKLVEKAIEHNYPMPEGVFDTQRLDAKKNVAGRKADWSNMRSGIAWFAWGVGITLFFIMADGKEVACLGIVLIIIGLGRMFIAYNNNKNLEDEMGDSADNGEAGMPTPPPFDKDVNK